jgi:hypothetical protein
MSLRHIREETDSDLEREEKHHELFNDFEECAPPLDPVILLNTERCWYQLLHYFAKKQLASKSSRERFAVFNLYYFKRLETVKLMYITENLNRRTAMGSKVYMCLIAMNFGAHSYYSRDPDDTKTASEAYPFKTEF